MPPYVPGIRDALQAAAEAEIDPESLYRRAAAMYEDLDTLRARLNGAKTLTPPLHGRSPWPLARLIKESSRTQR